MYTLTLSNPSQLDRANARARQEQPEFRFVTDGVYEVISSNGRDRYTTGILPNPEDGSYTVCCTCPCQNSFCKHLAAVWPDYQAREARKVRSIMLCQNCKELPAATGNGQLCAFCQIEREIMLEKFFEGGAANFVVVAVFSGFVPATPSPAAPASPDGKCKNCQTRPVYKEGLCQECSVGKDEADLFG